MAIMKTRANRCTRGLCDSHVEKIDLSFCCDTGEGELNASLPSVPALIGTGVVVQAIAGARDGIGNLVDVALRDRSGIQDTNRVADQPGSNVLHRVSVRSRVEFLGQVTGVAGQHRVLQLPQRMIGGQGFDIVDVQTGSRDPLRAQGFDERGFVDDRAA